MTPDFKDIDVRELLPQKEPYILVDELVSWSETETRTRFTVRDGGVMVENGLLRAAGLMEMMAQTAALRIGYIHKYILQRPIGMGYVGAVKNMIINRQPKVGETIDATLRVSAEAGNLSQVEVLLSVKSEAIAWGKMTVALQQ